MQVLRTPIRQTGQAAPNRPCLSCGRNADRRKQVERLMELVAVIDMTGFMANAAQTGEAKGEAGDKRRD